VTPLRVAVVGLGYWGPNLVRNLAELDDSELAWLCDLDPDRLAALGRRYPGVGLTDSFDDVLEDPTVDCVVIATPVSTHFGLASRALTADKHVLVEKPLCASSEQAYRLAALSAERGLVLMPGHTFLYSPPVVAIHSLIRSGALGELYFVSSSRVNLGLHQSDVSVVWDLAPHDFSILRYWLGETPTHVSAMARACVMPDIPDVAFVDLAYGSGTLAHVEMSWLAPSKLRRTTIVGSEKMVVYDDTSSEPVRIFDSGVNLPDPETFGEYRLTYRTGDIVSPRVDAAEPLSLELRDFCSAVRGEVVPRSTLGLGVEVVRMIESTERSLAEGGARVEVAADRSGAGLAEVLEHRVGGALAGVAVPERDRSGRVPDVGEQRRDLFDALRPGAEDGVGAELDGDGPLGGVPKREAADA
jgi:predicted dehydrogenase